MDSFTKDVKVILFKTERLEVRFMKEVDYPYFEELLTAPEIVDPIPQRPFPLRIVREKFAFSLVWAD